MSVSCFDLPDGCHVALAGRVVNFRKLGSIAFGKLVDQDGKIQFCFNKKLIPETYKEWSSQVKMGDIVYIAGEMWTSSTGERTVVVSETYEVLRRSMHPWPNKVDGIVDPELKLRKRYLDIIMDPEVKKVFATRSKVVSHIRSFMERHEFMEIETPVLQAQASGAQARTFSTHHNAFDVDMHLRIAPETYLKRAVAASFDKVFEIGKNFRNEGADPAHLQEFTSIEWYAAYYDYRDNLELFRQLLWSTLCELGFRQDSEELFGTTYKVEYQGTVLDFTAAANYSDMSIVRKYEDVFEEYTGVSPWSLSSAKEIDERFKAEVRPNLIQPVFLIDYPAHMSPLAHRSEDGRTVEQWQLVVNGWELVKCYTELTDPVLQRQLLEEQMAQRADGDEEAMMLEEDFLECMEYGMPPQSGLGMGIDRFVALLTNQTSLRNVVLFPTVL
jgi:lysyl-tRNA synthetase class 2